MYTRYNRNTEKTVSHSVKAYDNWSIFLRKDKITFINLTCGCSIALHYIILGWMSCRMLVRLCTSSVMAATGQRWSETGATLNNSDCCHACHTCVLPLIPCHYVFLCHALKSTVQIYLGWTSGLLAGEETKSVVQAQAVINKQHLTCHLCQWQGHLTTYVTLTDSLSHRTYGSLLACLSKC